MPSSYPYFRSILSGALLSAVVLLANSPGVGQAQSGGNASATGYEQAPPKSEPVCPGGWVPSSAPGGCSPEFFTLKLVRLDATGDCPSGWIKSGVPGGCSPEFMSLKLNGVGGTNECPSGWVVSRAPGGCSPGYITLRQAGIAPTGTCPEGWVVSNAPGGCSPGSFTLEERRIYTVNYTCAFGVACDVMVDAILALGGTCDRDGPDSHCELPPVVED